MFCLSPVNDFNSTDDTIRVDDTGFGGGLAIGTLLPTQFVLGTVATDGDNRFIYDLSTGALFFDVDGTSSQARIQIATLVNKSIVSYEDIVIV